MKKIRSILTILFSFSLLMGIYGSASATPEFKKTKKQINSIVRTKNREEEKSNYDTVGDKSKKKMEVRKKEIGNEKNKLEKKLKQNIENVKKQAKDRKKEVKKKIKQEKEKLKQNLKNGKEKVKNLTDDVKDSLKAKVKNVVDFKFNEGKFLLIPVKINSNSKYVKAVVMQDLARKINESDLIEKDAGKRKHISLNFRLYDILKNNDNESKLIVNADESYGKNLNSEVDLKKLEDFVKNYKLTKEDFERSKKEILDRLNKGKTTMEQNIDMLKNNKVQFKVSPLVDLQNNALNNEKFYDHFMKYPLKEIDSKLYYTIAEKFNDANAEDKDMFFKDSFEKSKKFCVDRYNENFNKSFTELTSRGGFIPSFEKLSYKEFDKNLKIEKISKVDTPKKEEIDLKEIDKISDSFNFKPDELVIGYFDSLALSNEKKADFLNYYEEELKSIKGKKEDDDELKDRATKIVKQMLNSDSLLKNSSTSEDVENIKKKNLVFGESYKTFKEKYCETLINHIKKQIFETENS